MSDENNRKIARCYGHPFARTPNLNRFAANSSNFTSDLLYNKLYDDGGYSGGYMDRPGLQDLISDFKAGLIDIIVVYKVDRLTRSLTDFAKLVDIFDAVGTLYQLFSDADDMIEQMKAKTLAALNKSCRNFDLREGPEASLKRLSRKYVGFTRANPNLWAAIFDHTLPDGHEHSQGYLSVLPAARTGFALSNAECTMQIFSVSGFDNSIDCWSADFHVCIQCWSWNLALHCFRLMRIDTNISRSPVSSKDLSS
jgi:hypothetical protein